MDVICRCIELGRLYPTFEMGTCNGCRLNAVDRDLEQTGFVRITHGHRQAYIDCGVEVRSYGSLGAKDSWAPGWAAAIVEVLFNTGFCGPVLARAVVDAEFREACDTVLRLTPTRIGSFLPVNHLASLGVLRGKLEALATSAGLTPLPPVA